ncbi:MAG: efflux RND transporter permease subunit, partial [Proteobacteria bacterium]|nr:efflux RND transporter permease subunit [Pseudomonadota bacterium]
MGSDAFGLRAATGNDRTDCGGAKDIYTEVGLITLISLITKQSILVVEFANVLQEREGLDVVTAIRKASSIRLRPIVMTSAAMAFGVVPLLFAAGPGA